MLVATTHTNYRTYFKVFSLVFQNSVCLYQPRRELLGKSIRMCGKIQQDVFFVEIFGGNHYDLVVGGKVARYITFGQHVDNSIGSPGEMFSRWILCQCTDSVCRYNLTLRINYYQVGHAIGLKACYELRESRCCVGKTPPRHLLYILLIVLLTFIEGTENNLIVSLYVCV